MKRYFILITALFSLLLLNSTSFADESMFAQGTLNKAFSSWGKASLQGDWKIVKDADRYFIELNDNFKAKEGPDVKIFLSPKAASDVTGDNATDGSTLVLQISKFEGADRIEIPTGVNLADFKSLVFHCEAYSKLWGTSAINAG